MKKFMKRFFILSMLVLTAGGLCLLPNSQKVDKNGGEIAIESVSADGLESAVNLFDEVAVASESNIPATEAFFGHSSVYVIDSAEKLAYVSYQVANGNGSFKDGVFKLVADIDLSGSLWTPIGTYSNPFTGVFYGCGYSISNITINDASIDSNANSCAGLFGNTDGASICDITLSGSMVYNTSKTKGSLVGNLKNSEIINCYDESSKVGLNGTAFSSSVGATSGSYIFRGGSKDGVSGIYNTADLINSTITSSGATLGYVGFYNIANGAFMKENSEWHDTKQVRVLLDSSGTVYSGYSTKGNNLYTNKAVVLRENASATDIYPLREGYQAVVGSFAVANSYIQNISYQQKTISVSFNYQYGDRTMTISSMPYDKTFQSYFNANSFMKDRVGYDFAGLFSGANGTGTQMKIDAYDYKIGFPSSSATYYFKWTAQTGKNVYFQFAIDKNEGGTGFVGVEGLTRAVASIGGGVSLDSENKYNKTGITSGQTATFSFTLEDGYTISSLSDNTSTVTLSNFKANVSSGIYANFNNTTGKAAAYRVNAITNNDSHNAPTAAVAEKSGNTYTISVDNIVGPDGVVYIVISRTEYQINLAPVFAEEENPVKYKWKLLNGTTETDEISGCARIVGDILYVRKHEKPTIRISTNFNESTDGVVIGVDACNIKFPVATTTITDANASKTENPIADLDYYETWTFNIPDRILGGGNLTVKLGRLITRLSLAVNFVDESGSTISPSADQISGLGIKFYSGDSYRLTNSGFFIYLSQTDVITIQNNGYFIASALNVNPGTSYNLGNPNSDNLTILERTGIFANIYEGGTGINYSVSITFKLRTYDIKYEYYFYNEATNQYEQKTTNIANLFKVASSVGGIKLQSLEDLSFNTNIVIDFDYENLGSAILKFDSCEVASGDTKTGYNESTIVENQAGKKYTLTLGNYDTTVKFYFSFRSVNIKINKLQLLASNNTTLTELSEGIKEVSSTHKFSYDFANNKTSLRGEFKNISIHAEYFLLGWYLENGSVRVTSNYQHILSDSNIIADMVNVGSSTTGNSFDYNGVKAFVQQRIVNVKQNAGAVGYGKFYNSSKQEITSEADKTHSAGSVTYNAKLTISNSVFYNLGYSFSSWSVSSGNLGNGQYSIYGENWRALFGISVDNEELQIWNSFSSLANQTREVTLTSNWNIISYQVLIDNSGKANIKIGEEIKYSTDKEARNGQAQFFIGTTNAYGEAKNGYEVTGYEIEHGGKQSVAGGAANGGYYGKFSLSVSAFLSIISDANRFEANGESNPIKITTLREACVYKIYLVNSAEGYYSYRVGDLSSKGYGGIEGNVIYINVAFDSAPTNLVNAVDEGLITISRTGYTANGWRISNAGKQGEDFDVTKAYTALTNTYIVPEWKFETDTTQSEIDFGQDVGDLREFYLTNAHDILFGSIGGSNVDAGDNVASLPILNNGEKVKDYGFNVTFGGVTTKYSKDDTLNIDIFNKAGLVSVKFYITVVDTLNVQNPKEYTVESESQTFTMRKNEIYLFGQDLRAVYTGTSEFIAATEEKDGINNNFGSFLYRYEWNGQDCASANPLVAIGSTNEYFQNYIIDGTDYSAGSNKTLRMELNLNKFGSSSWDELFSNVSKSGSNYYIVVGGLTIEKAKITISFGEGSAYYINGVQTIVYENSSSYQFSVGQSTFTYTYSRILLKPNALAGVYAGEEKYSNDSTRFVVESLKVGSTISVTDTNGTLVEGNFEWNISKDSKFTLIDSSSVRQLQYSARYLLAENGFIKARLSEIYDGNADRLQITKIEINGVEQTVPTSSQYTITYENQVVMSVAGNNGLLLFVYFNPDIASIANVEFEVSINFVDDHASVLYPLAWGTSTTPSYYNDAFINSTGKASLLVEPANVSNSTTYAILTDAVKINLNYNGGVEENETIYVAKTAPLTKTNPTFDYAGISFGGYTNPTEANLTASKSGSSTTFTVTKGGKEQTLTAKWNFNSIVAEMKVSEIERYASTTGIDLALNDLISITSEGLFSAKTYNLLKGSTNFTFDSASRAFKVKDGRGYAVPDMSGEYKIRLSFTFEDGVQAPQTITREQDLKFTFNIVPNLIGVSYKGPTIEYRNIDLSASTNISFTLNGEANGSVSLATLSKSDNIDAVKSVYISMAPSLVFKQAGEYQITFNVVSALNEIYQFENKTASTILNIEIKKYTILLKDYVGQIDLSKVFGQDDPNPISTIITISENVNEEVAISFTRVSGENKGLYALSFKEIIDNDDKTNYTVNIDGFSADFEIQIPNENLVVSLKNSFEYTYNGSALSEFEITYDSTSKRFVLSAYAGELNLSVEFDLFYKASNVLIPIPDDAEVRQAFIEIISFSGDGDKNAGEHSLSVILTQDGQNAGWKGVEFLNEANSKINVEKREITVNSIIKTFDQSKDFTTESAELSITNIVEGEEVNIAGTTDEEEAGDRKVVSLEITGPAEAFNNYVIADYTTLKVKINPSDEQVNVTNTSETTFTYGSRRPSGLRKTMS